MELLEGTKTLILSFSDEPIRLKEAEDDLSLRKMSGSWEPGPEEPEGWENWRIRYPKSSIHGLSFFIGPLVNCVREFGWGDDETDESDLENEYSYEEEDGETDENDIDIGHSHENSADNYKEDGETNENEKDNRNKISDEDSDEEERQEAARNANLRTGWKGQLSKDGGRIG